MDSSANALLALEVIRAIEERAFNAWPALQTLVIGGWLVRLSEGYTKRANSANAYARDAAPLAEVIDEIEAIYRRNGLNSVIRMTPLARVEDAEVLYSRDYVSAAPTVLMLAPPGGGAADPCVTFADRPSTLWLDRFAAGNVHGPAWRPVMEKMIDAIQPRVTFAMLEEGGRSLAYGYAVVERGMAGLFDILVEPEARQRGYGRRLTAALMDWALRAGARHIYLQVMAENEAAVALYRGLGFEKAYRYSYWIK